MIEKTLCKKIIKGKTLAIDQEGLSPARGYLVPKVSKVMPLTKITQGKIDTLLKYTGYGTYLYVRSNKGSKLAWLAIAINYLTPHVALAAAKDYKQQTIYRVDGTPLYVKNI